MRQAVAARVESLSGQHCHFKWATGRNLEQICQLLYNQLHQASFACCCSAGQAHGLTNTATLSHLGTTHRQATARVQHRCSHENSVREALCVFHSPAPGPHRRTSAGAGLPPHGRGQRDVLQLSYSCHLLYNHQITFNSASRTP